VLVCQRGFGLGALGFHTALFGQPAGFDTIGPQSREALSDFMVDTDLIAEPFNPGRFATAKSLRPPARQP